MNKTKTLPITYAYLKTLSNTLGFRPKLKISRLPTRIEHKNFIIRQPIRIEYHCTKKHPRALSQGGGPFSALGSSRLSIAYHNT